MTTRKLPFLPSRLLYVADKQNKFNYLIDTGAAVGVLTKSCANGTEDTSSLPLVPAINTTISTYRTCKRAADVGYQTRLRLDIYSPGYKATYFRSRFSDTL